MYREHRSINARNVRPIDIIIILINGWTSVLICIEHCVQEPVSQSPCALLKLDFQSLAD